MNTDTQSLRTLAITTGRPKAAPGEPLNAPIVLASNFHASPDQLYSRSDGTPSWAAFEQALGALEGGEAIAFASGMAAVSAVLEVLPPAALVLLPGDCYHGVTELVHSSAGRWRCRTIDITDNRATIDALDGADLLWLESPTNPLLDVADLRALCAEAKHRQLMTVVDNTFATPMLQRPLELGADVVVHSATKFIGGHSDLLLGAVVAGGTSLHQQLVHQRERRGATPGGIEAFLALRGLRTLPIRLERSQQTAIELASRLAADPRIARVRYPGLSEDPGHRLASEQMDGYGGVLSFEVAAANDQAGAEAADQVCATTRIITHTTSLGGVESTLERRAGIAGQEHLPASLIRLSVGLEDVEDLWRDLDQALAATAESDEQDDDDQR